jgi:putative ABC transport system ATP-binding protein
LSGGQKQRISIARALVANPRVILADEPTGALDSQTSVEVMQLLQQVNREGMTIVMVTHNPEMAAMSQKIIKIRDGIIGSVEHNKRSGNV